MKIQNSQTTRFIRTSAVPHSFRAVKITVFTQDCKVPHGHSSILFALFEVHYDDFLTGMLGPDVRHHIGRLLAAKLAIGALEARRLTALKPEMPGHIALDSEATAAFRTAVELLAGAGERALRTVSISHASMREVIHP